MISDLQLIVQANLIGTEVVVTDATNATCASNDVITGGSSIICLAISNGTNYIHIQ